MWEEEEGRKKMKEGRRRRRKGHTWWWNEDVKEETQERKKHTRQCVKTVLRRMRGLKPDSKEVEGGRCMRGSDGKLCFSEKEKGKVWKDYMERVMNQEIIAITMRMEMQKVQ